MLSAGATKAQYPVRSARRSRRVNSPSSQKPIQDPTNSSGFGGLASLAWLAAGTSAIGNEAPNSAKTASTIECIFIGSLKSKRRGCRSINQLVAEPSGEEGKAGPHQAETAGLAPPFRSPIIIGQGGFQCHLRGSDFQRECWIERLRLGGLFELLEHAPPLLPIEH